MVLLGDVLAKAAEKSYHYEGEHFLKVSSCFVLFVVWVFGGMERLTGECFLVEVEHRDAATLLPLIQQYIRPGSVVYSDEWSAYNQLATVAGCNHQTVNHSLHFVDPNTGAHTQVSQTGKSFLSTHLGLSVL